jgi:hypothetical protein
MASFKSFNAWGWFVSVNTRFQIPQRTKKSHVERSGERGGNGTSPKREIRCPGNMFRTGSTGQVSIATEVANPEGKNAYHLVVVVSTPLAYLLSTTHSKDVSFEQRRICWADMTIWMTAKEGRIPNECTQKHVQEILKFSIPCIHILVNTF